MKDLKKYIVFIAETDKMYSFMLNFKLQRNSNFEIHSFPTGDQCVNNLSLKPDIIILDLKTILKNIQLVLNEIRKTFRNIPVILLSEPEDLSIIKKFCGDREYDFLIKDKDSSRQADLLIQRIMNCLERKKSKSTRIRQKLIALYLAVGLLMIALALFYLKSGGK